jgi:hypothetical protein
MVSQRSYTLRLAVSIRYPVSLQLEPPQEDRNPRYGRIGNFMVSRLGNVNITALGNFLLRPGSETSLPPICKVREHNWKCSHFPKRFKQHNYGAFCE